MDVKFTAAIAGAVRRGEIAEFCRVHQISRTTFYKWRARYREAGLAGLQERSRRPSRSPNRIDPAVEEAIVVARKRLQGDGSDAGPWSIYSELLATGIVAPSESTIYRVLRNRGFITAQPRKRPKSSLHRFVWPRPNDCWQIDATHFELANGTVVEIINIIDDHSRLLVASVAVPSCLSSLAWAAMVTGFSRWGVPARVLSDNGLAFSGARRGVTVTFETNLHHLGVHTITSTPYHPQTCGKVERFHQTLKKWIAARPTPTSITELQHLIDQFSDHYNHHRPHRALGRKTPASVWHATPRAVPEHTLTTTTTNTLTITVDNDGKARAHRYWWGIGTKRRGHTITVIHDNTTAAIFDHDTFIGTTTINPTRRYQRITHHPPQ